MKLFQQTREALQKTMQVANVHAVPRVAKVIVSVGVGKHRDDKKFVEAVKADLAAITGQAPALRRAKKSVAGFNVRQGNLVGFQVTLRGKRAEDFVTRLIHVTLPRVRDFRGVSKNAFDGQGNLSLGLREQLPFPEIHADKTDVVFGVQITISTTATSNQEAEVLLRAMGFPLA
ncbi:MAG: 50S ribosomal protein L5 [Patescibacteria group bacterium]